MCWKCTGNMLEIFTMSGNTRGWETFPKYRLRFFYQNFYYNQFQVRTDESAITVN